jgi:neurofibromin 1
MTATLATTPSVPILEIITSLFDKALSDPQYSFPSQPGLGISESMTSLSLHQKSVSGSISSQPSISGVDGGLAGRAGANASAGGRDQMLEDLGMKGLVELGFPSVKMDR